MKSSSGEAYSIDKGVERINSILKSADSDFSQSESIPDLSRLTYENGFYTKAAVIFVDIRKSQDLSKSNTKPALAKIYRAYISEVVAAISSNDQLAEVFIEGDAVWGIIDVGHKEHIAGLFNTAAMVASVVDLVNLFLSESGLPEIKVGIGLSCGETLVMKAGYKGSGINEFVWIGRVVGEAATLCSYGSKTPSDFRVMASHAFYKLLPPNQQSLLSFNRWLCYHGDVVSPYIADWIREYKTQNLSKKLAELFVSLYRSKPN